MKPSAPKPSQKFQVLVVDYDSRRAHVMLSSLAELNMECRHAPNGQLGLKAFSEKLPHLVLLDVMMPGMDGYQVCTHMRACSTVPIILMNESVTNENMMKGLKTGADAYISKSMHAQVLAAHVISWLRRVYQYDKCDGPPEAHNNNSSEENGLIDAAATAPASAQPPAGWLRCEACSYMGPRAKFEQPDPADLSLYCPACHSRVVIAHSL